MKLGALLAASSLLTLGVSCVAQRGEGSVTGELDVVDCWSGNFDLEPNFFGAAVYEDTLTLRIQRDSDFFTFADGVAILIDDLHAIRGDDQRPSQYGAAIPVGLPSGVAPPGSPVAADPTPTTVHLNLYLQKTCRTQNVALHAAEAVQLNADGSCQSVRPVCSDETSTEPSTLGHSTITYDNLFNGDILSHDERDTRIRGHFDVYLTDPREACPGGGSPPPCRGHLIGDFDYEYNRSRPYQPFP